MTARRLRRGDVIALATGNGGKRAEFARLLAPYGIAIAPGAPPGLAAVVEDAPDFAGNARIKALAVARASGLPALADDSGFSIRSLGGAPGVRSARFADAAGGHVEAMRRLAAAAVDHPGREAAFGCALCLAWPDGAAETAEGVVDGHWIWPPRGGGGFGYDPMFVPVGLDRSFAELDGAAKDARGHRGRAFAMLAARTLPSTDGSADGAPTEDPADGVR